MTPGEIRRLSEAARRQRALYRRRQSGQIVLPVEVDLARLGRVLLVAGLIDESRTDDRAALGAGLQRLVGLLLQRPTVHRHPQKT